MIGLFASISVLMATVTSCGASDREEGLDVNNLLEYGVTITDGMFSPAQVTFYMTVDEVLKAKELDPSTVSEDEILGWRIVNTVPVTNLSDEMTEVYNFSEGQLISVEYIIATDDDEQEEICNSLYEQAGERMPAPVTDNLEDIKNGQEMVLWLDEKQNSVILSFPKTNDDEPNAIILGVYVSKNSD